MFLVDKNIDNDSFISQILDSVHVGIIIVDVEKRIIIHVNECALRIIGRSRDDVVGKLYDTLLYSEDSCMGSTDNIDRCKDDCKLEIIRNDGSAVMISKSSVIIERNHKKMLLETFMDISKQVKSDMMLQISDRKYYTMFMNTGIASIVIDEDMSISMANNEFINLMKINAESIKSKPSFINFFQNNYIDKLIQFHKIRRICNECAPRNYEVSAVNSYDEIIELYVTVAMIPGTKQSIASFVDITEFKLTKQMLINQSYKDRITGLSNRIEFIELLEYAIASVDRRGGIIGIALLDLDEFKNVNDSLGHSAGDNVLIEVANRLKSVLRSSGKVARLGGDEFAVMISDLSDPDDLAVISRKIMHVFNLPFIIDGNEFFVGASIGISIYPSDGKTSEKLLQCADMAMYRSKSLGKNTFTFYTESLNEKVIKRANFENNLRLSLNENRVIAHYQPIVSLINRKVVCFEALARIVMKDGSVSLNAEFITMAEKSALITKVDTAILNHACSWISSLNDIGYNNVRVAVNISAKHLLRGNLITKIRDAIDLYGVNPCQLEIEITETAIMENLNNASRIMSDLIDMGINFSLDDFGTGYSSLSYLRHLPVKKLKIDKSFTARYDTVDGSALLVTIVNLAKNLGLEPLAEGVETEEQASYLFKIGCKLAQGWLFSKAIPSCDAEYFVCNPFLHRSMHC